MADNNPFLTRRQSAKYIQTVLGIPCRESRIDKDAARGKGPRASARYGRVFLYRVEDLHEYAQGLIEPLQRNGEAA